MSNSANSDEIDEVMSSVRKLVSKGDSQPVHDQNAQKTGGAAERLILTPALRVAEPDPQPETPDEPGNTDNVLVLDSGKRPDPEGLEATIAQLEAAVSVEPDDWEPEEAETFDEAAWAVSALASVDPSSDEDDIEADAETDTEATAEAAADTPAPAGDEVVTAEDLPESEPADDPMPQDNAVSEPDDMPEFKAGLSEFLDPSATIDEQILRDMIVQIIREELRGDTGERITRNVRKLVRREINQMLATRDIR